MKKIINKKSSIVILIGLICIPLLIVVLWWTNDAYQPTIEKAYQQGVKAGLCYEMEQELGLFNYGDEALWLYVSEDEILCTVTFKYDSKREKWTISAKAELGYVSDLGTRWSDIYGNESCAYEMIGGTTLVGYRLHDGKTPFVNGQKTTVYTYQITCENQVHYLDFWELKGFSSNQFNQIQLSFKED